MNKKSKIHNVTCKLGFDKNTNIETVARYITKIMPEWSSYSPYGNISRWFKLGNGYKSHRLNLAYYDKSICIPFDLSYCEYKKIWRDAKEANNYEQLKVFICNFLDIPEDTDIRIVNEAIQENYYVDNEHLYGILADFIAMYYK